MRVRNHYGGTLSLMAACTLVTVMIGLAIYFLTKILGGGKEILNANDSANLGLSRAAIRWPAVPPTSLIQRNNFTGLGDPDARIGGNFNLGYFNKPFGMTLLVAINAKNENTAEARDHAVSLIEALEGSNSLGKELAQKLETTTSNELFNAHYDPLLNQQNVRMLGLGSAPRHESNDFKVAYMEQTADDPGATNLSVPASLEDLIRSTLPSTAIITEKDGKKYIRGYINAAADLGFGQPFAGVPVNPDSQPQLVSKRNFDREQRKPAALASVFPPPNAFQCTATAAEERSSSRLGALSCAKVGSLRLQYPISIARGYVEIMNKPPTSPGFTMVPVGGGQATFPALNNVLNNEAIDGIHVAGGCFSTDIGVLDEQAAYNKLRAEGEPPFPPRPPIGDNLFRTSDGGRAEEADAATIPYRTDGTAEYVLCNCDTSTNPAPVEPVCKNLLDRFIFDEAYHGPGAGPQLYQEPGAASGLMSAECAKCKVSAGFNLSPLTVSVNDCGPTGLKIFPHNQPLPYRSSSGLPRCIISRPGTVKELVIQTARGDSSAWSRVFEGPNGLLTRMQQIEPSLTKPQAEALLESRRLELGDRLYIYKHPVTQRLVFDANTPPGKINNDPPDGPILGPPPYDYIIGSVSPSDHRIVNPGGDMDIHDRLYYGEDGGSNLRATDFATWQPGTGFDNNLGRMWFVNLARGSATFSKPN